MALDKQHEFPVMMDKMRQEAVVAAGDEVQMVASLEQAVPSMGSTEASGPGYRIVNVAASSLMGSMKKRWKLLKR